ncbi:two component transcriptional regulator, winged helix family [Xylanimonas cellulosilytica DSM 15894]|uniref:Two component transcriptional regulator, winged helix family n=1 Tax=Xylanimonas cellulosilytica (strain DSM 15894 / JCM 12276 / CECT 5975 / KCTC 9989 / LMG 20990 / NBRC 107835 / XIL07) TaxID=446471 RepID=D1BZA1_XYLCX|nr:response regulator transcription factor [Xylanimonas cellulosilytica]ACZ31998.1 two component transcriptional regulator, winged helix family [Xylanimonas cellulosilytica DSM 15894]
MSAAPRALVVDDEPQMLAIVEFALQTQGFECVTAPDAERAWRVLLTQDVDLAVLDVMLPGASGIELCRRIRSRLDVPVLLLTARGETEDRIAGLEAGADDYVPKPFSPREVALRAQALVRRTGARHEPRDVVVNGPVRVDVLRRTLTSGGEVVHLSELETRLLATLAERAGEVVTWRDLLNDVWSTASVAGGREMVKTAVYRVRQRLPERAGEPLVVTVRGRGYLMPRLDR